MESKGQPQDPNYSPEALKAEAKRELRSLLGQNDLPFSKAIMDYHPSKGFVLPKINLDDGKGDPMEHFIHY